MNFAKTALQLVSREAQKEVQNITQLTFDANFGAGELCRHGTGVDDCKALLENSRADALAAKGFEKIIVRTRSGSAVSTAVLYKNDVLAVLRRQMTIGLSQDVVFSLLTVPKHIGHPIAALHGQGTEKGVREKATGLARRDV